MKLTELHPHWINHVSETEEHWNVRRKKANGILFLCPECTRRKKNGENIHVHSVICLDVTVPQTAHPNPGRWNLLGNTFKDLSLINVSSSVALNGGCNAHFFIKNGEIIFA